MSKEEYLKGEEKDKALGIIRYGLSVRLSNEETLELLQSKGICISERTLQRFKNEIHDDSGFSAFAVFQKAVGDFLLNDILAYEEMERQCWKIINSSTDNMEKIKTISVLRSVNAGKLNILKSYPRERKVSTCKDWLPRVGVPWEAADERISLS